MDRPSLKQQFYKSDTIAYVVYEKSEADICY